MQYTLGIAIYSAILAILYVYLTVVVIKARQRFNVPVGDGGYADLSYKLRAQANFNEHVPLVLVFMTVGIKLGMPLITFHLVGISLVLGRCLHAFGLGYCELKNSSNVKCRMLGMLLTFIAYLLVIGYFTYVITAMIYHPIRHG